jgi:hypothetical protein
MKALWQRWNFMRILRLVLAIAILAQGIYARESIAILVGVALGGMVLANISCCGGSACAVNARSSKTKTKIEYEELDIKE